MKTNLMAVKNNKCFTCIFRKWFIICDAKLLGNFSSCVNRDVLLLDNFFYVINYKLNLTVFYSIYAFLRRQKSITGTFQNKMEIHSGHVK